jgi:uncharacterized protein
VYPTVTLTGPRQSWKSILLKDAFREYKYGLACSLLYIKGPTQVTTHFLRGGLFENLVINNFVKDAYNKGGNPNITFWRDSTGNEVDLLIKTGDKQNAYEIKSGATYSQDYFKGIKTWAKLSGAIPEQCFAIYNGKQTMKTSFGKLIPWNAYRHSVI